MAGITDSSAMALIVQNCGFLHQQGKSGSAWWARFQFRAPITDCFHLADRLFELRDIRQSERNYPIPQCNALVASFTRVIAALSAVHRRGIPSAGALRVFGIHRAQQGGRNCETWRHVPCTLSLPLPKGFNIPAAQPANPGSSPSGKNIKRSCRPPLVMGK